MPEGRVVVAVSPYQSAPWMFVVGRAFLAAVPAGTARAIVRRLTKWVTAPEVQLESLVALLPVAGADQVPSFVIVVPAHPDLAAHPRTAVPLARVAEDGVSISVVVRGDIVADLFSVGGSRRFHDRGIRPWLLADFRSVIGVAIGSASEPLTAFEDRNRGRSVNLGDVTGGSLFWDPASAAPDTQPFLDSLVDGGSDTVLSVPHEPRGAAVFDPVGDTVLAADHPTGMPAESGTILPPPAAAAPHLRRGFRVASGDRLSLDHPYYVGRNPRLPRIISGELPILLPVSAPTSAVSSTHLEIRQNGTSVVVTDLGSTNGTFVTEVSGQTRRLRSGQSLAVVPGTVVDIGDGNLIEILG